MWGIQKRGQYLGQSPPSSHLFLRLAGRLSGLPDKGPSVCLRSWSQRGFSQSPPVQSMIPGPCLPGPCLLPHPLLPFHLKIAPCLSLSDKKLGFQAPERDFLLAEPSELFPSQTEPFLQAPRCAAPQTGLHPGHPGIRAAGSTPSDSDSLGWGAGDGALRICISSTLPGFFPLGAQLAHY